MAQNKQRLVAAVLSEDDYAAAVAHCTKHGIKMSELVRRGVGLALNRPLEALKPGRRWPSKPSK